MKTLKILSTAVMISLFFNFSFPHTDDPATDTPQAVNSLKVDPNKSELVWNAKKVGGEHTGTVKLASGSLEVDGKKLTGGAFSIDMTTIKDTDITMESMNEKLTGHLKSEDFFSVEKYPNAHFKITKVAPVDKAKAGEDNYYISGDLTIKGISHEISFPAQVKIEGEQAEANALIEVDRTKWDIKYRAAIIGTAADKIIDDTFTIDLKLVANGSKTASR